MDTEKQRSRAGSFLQLLDWHSKSRKRLFSSSKSNKADKSKQRSFDGKMSDDDGSVAGSSIRESCGFSCASSFTDEDFSSNKAPGVVARLMGLDSLPKQNLLETRSFDLDNVEPRFTRVIEKFQTEVLPPKSAKTIPITQQKLLSPMKKKNFIPTRDAAQIMEAAASIIQQVPHVGGVPSTPLRVGSVRPNDVRPMSLSTAQKKAQATLKSKESTKTIKSLKAADGGQGKSVSLALQAKTNVLKKQRQNMNATKSMDSTQSEMIFSGESVGKMSSVRKASAKSSSTALRQNNQKQNSIVCSGANERSLSAVKRETSNRLGSSKVCSSKRKSEIKEERKQDLKTGSNKRGISTSHSSESAQRKRKSKNGNDIDVQISSDVVSFTFTTPISQQGSVEASPADSGAPKSLFLGNAGGSIRSNFEQTLKELCLNVDLPGKNSGKVSVENGQHSSLCSLAMAEDSRTELDITDHLQGQPSSSFGSRELNTPKTSQNCQVEVHEEDSFADRKPYDHQLPTPISVLEFPSLTESCNSAETVDNNSTGDSASSAMASKQEEASLESQPNSWELDYLKEILSDIETMFTDYALGKTCEVINPHLFYQIECQRLSTNPTALIPRITRRLWFDCTSESTSLRCRQHVGGGWRLWAKGVEMVRRNDELAEDIHREVCGWIGVGETMVDELVEREMSLWRGRWLGHEGDGFEVGMQIESWILDSIIHEEVRDIAGCLAR